jgi:hypothetical protein
VRLAQLRRLVVRFEEASKGLLEACRAGSADVDSRTAVEIAGATLELAKRDLYEAMGWQLFSEGSNDNGSRYRASSN